MPQDRQMKFLHLMHLQLQYFQFGTGPNINSVRADNGNHKVVYFGLALEQINDLTIAGIL